MHVPVMMSPARVCSSKSPKPFVSDVKMAEHSSLDIIPVGCRIKEVTSAVSLLEYCRNSITFLFVHQTPACFQSSPLPDITDIQTLSYAHTYIIVISLLPAQTHIRNTWLPGTQPLKKHQHASNCNPNNCLLIYIYCLREPREEYQRLHRRRRRRRVNLFFIQQTNKS